MKPILYIVATPIGTLSDLSPHAQEILGSVAFIMCEDTRQTQKLLQHCNMRVPLKSLNLHNEKQKCEYLLDLLLQSEQQCAALVSDAGTPSVSDPGAFLVAAAHARGVQILSVPGPSSLAAAIASCGFIQPRVIFSGFLGRTKKQQEQEFARWQAVSPCIAVFFESPYRILASLQSMQNYFADTVQVCVSREISKKFEEHQRGILTDVITYFTEKKIKGEFTVCVNIGKE